MKSTMLACFIASALVSLPALAEKPALPDKKAVSFKSDIRPLLDDYCKSCHVPGGKGYEKSGLDMRSYGSLMKGTRYGSIIKPGNSQDSTLIVLVEGRADPSISMPYGIKGGLSKDKIAILRKWIDQGAKDN
ncbi:MAG TPA: c-type cytochrome domain-containing protein [Gallionellaceae bacterium]